MRESVLKRYLERYFGAKDPQVTQEPNDIDKIVEGIFFRWKDYCFFVYTREEAKKLASFVNRSSSSHGFSQNFDILTSSEFENYYILS